MTAVKRFISGSPRSFVVSVAARMVALLIELLVMMSSSCPASTRRV